MADHQLLADLLMADLERVFLCSWSTQKRVDNLKNWVIS